MAISAAICHLAALRTLSHTQERRKHMVVPRALLFGTRLLSACSRHLSGAFITDTRGVGVRGGDCIRGIARSAICDH